MQLSGGEQQRVAIARALLTTVFALVLGVLIALPLLHFQLKLPTLPVLPPVLTAFGISTLLDACAKYLTRRRQLQPATLMRGNQ